MLGRSRYHKTIVSLLRMDQHRQSSSHQQLRWGKELIAQAETATTATPNNSTGESTEGYNRNLGNNHQKPNSLRRSHSLRSKDRTSRICHTRKSIGDQRHHPISAREKNKRFRRDHQSQPEKSVHRIGKNGHNITMLATLLRKRWEETGDQTPSTKPAEEITSCWGEKISALLLKGRVVNISIQHTTQGWTNQIKFSTPTTLVGIYPKEIWGSTAKYQIFQRVSHPLVRKYCCSAREMKVKIFNKRSAWELLHNSIQTTLYWEWTTKVFKQHSTGDEPQ